MTPPHPTVDEFELERVLQALADPIRLDVVRRLAATPTQTCAELLGGRPKSSMSHHFRVLIDAGVLRVTRVGTQHMNSLRAEELEQRFAGLLDAVLAAPRTERPRERRAVAIPAASRKAVSR